MARLRRRAFIVPVIAISVAQGIVSLAQHPAGAFVVLGLSLWIFFGFAVPRSHDIGNSGWYCLIPFYGLWLIFKDSQPFTNKWGPDPKGRGNQV